MMETRAVAANQSERLKNTADCLFHDSKNLAVNNLPDWLRNEDELARWDFFAQYGQIIDILTPGEGNISRCAVIRYESPESARAAMRCTNGALVSVKHPKLVAQELKAANEEQISIQVCALSVSLHPTRYCSYFLLERPCTKDQCVELHEEVATSSPLEAGAQHNKEELPPKIISNKGASYLPMVNYHAATHYIEKQLATDSGSDDGTSLSTPTTAGTTSVMDLINPNRQQKLSAGARPFVPGVGGTTNVQPHMEHRETRVATWQGVLTEEMALMAQIQSLRKDHSDPDWENTMFEPVVFPFTRGLALPSPAQKDSVDEKMVSEHRLHKVVEI